MPTIIARAVQCVALALCLTAAARVARAEPSSAPDPNHWIPVQVTWAQKVIMRDGVRLSATIYRNSKQTGPVPVIMAMTPYMTESQAKRGVTFAAPGSL